MKSWKRLLWIQLGKDTKAIEDLCVLSLDYNDMQIATAQDEIRQLFLSDYSKTSKGGFSCED